VHIFFDDQVLLHVNIVRSFGGKFPGTKFTAYYTAVHGSLKEGFQLLPVPQSVFEGFDV